MRTLAPLALALALLACDTPDVPDAGPDGGDVAPDAGPPDAGTDAGPPPPSCTIQLSDHTLDTVPYCPASEAYVSAALAADGGPCGLDGGADGGPDAGGCAGPGRLDVLGACPVWERCDLGDPPCYHCREWASDPR